MKPDGWPTLAIAALSASSERSASWMRDAPRNGSAPAANEKTTTLAPGSACSFVTSCAVNGVPSSTTMIRRLGEKAIASFDAGAIASTDAYVERHLVGLREGVLGRLVTAGGGGRRHRRGRRGDGGGRRRRNRRHGGGGGAAPSRAP